MEQRCSLCGKTVRELAEEELKERQSLDAGISIKLDKDIAYPYAICDGCADFLTIAIPAIMEAHQKAKLEESK